LATTSAISGKTVAGVGEVAEGGVQLVASGAEAAAAVGVEFDVVFGEVMVMQPGKKVRVTSKIDAIKSKTLVFIFFMSITYNKNVNSILIIYEKPPL
jgi:hypothetical protein